MCLVDWSVEWNGDGGDEWRFCFLFVVVFWCSVESVILVYLFNICVVNVATVVGPGQASRCQLKVEFLVRSIVKEIEWLRGD